jgi:hypothetical protein
VKYYNVDEKDQRRENREIAEKAIEERKAV